MLSFPERSGVLRKWLNIVKEIPNNKNIIMFALKSLQPSEDCAAFYKQEQSYRAPLFYSSFCSATEV